MAAKKHADAVRDRLVPASGQPVDCTLRITGALNVGAPQSAIVTDGPKAQAVLATVLEALGPKTLDTIRATVRQRWQEFVAGGDPPDVSTAAEELAEDLLALTTRPKMQERRGAVSGIFSVHVIARKARAEAQACS